MFAENLDQFFDNDQGFAVSVSISDGGAFNRSLAVIFNDESNESTIYETAVMDSQPHFLTPIGTTDGIRSGMIVTLENDLRSFKVEKIRPDGNGLAIVTLSDR